MKYFSENIIDITLKKKKNAINYLLIIISKNAKKEKNYNYLKNTHINLQLNTKLKQVYNNIS